jgi:hypothetical protein
MNEGEMMSQLGKSTVCAEASEARRLMIHGDEPVAPGQPLQSEAELPMLADPDTPCPEHKAQIFELRASEHLTFL